MYTYLAFVIGAFAGLCFGYATFVASRSYFRWHGKRLVTCPETKQTAAVAVDAKLAASESLLGTTRLRLNECSRWPERQGCGQEYLRQIELAPEGCLVRNIVGKWYAGKECVYCHKPFASADDIFHHKPALMGADRKTLEWDEIAPEKLPQTLATTLPVCWSCHIVENFWREHPELVVYNRWQNREGEWTHRGPSPLPEEGAKGELYR